MARVSRHCRLVAAALSLTACTVGPDYVPPEPDMPSGWTQKLGGGLKPGSFRGATWWEQLGDQKLTELIQRGVKANPSLAAAMMRIQQSRAVLGQVTGQWYPDNDAAGGYSRFRNSNSTTPFPMSGMDNWNAGVVSFWEIDLFGRIRRSVESADAQVQATVEDYHDVLTVLQADIALTYIQLRTLQRRIDLLQQNVQLQTASRELAKARFETEVAPELDVFQAESNLANTQAQLPNLQLELARTLHRLAVLLGSHAGQLNQELAQAKPLPKPPPAVSVGIPGELLRRRPDIRRAERQLAAQTALIGVAEAALYPNFSIRGALGLASIDLADLTRSRSRTYEVTPSFTWNLLDGGRVRGAVAEEEAATAVSRLAYDNAVLLATEEAENAIASFRLQIERRDRLSRVVTATKKSVELAEALYKQRLSDFQNVLDAQRTLFGAQDALAESEGAVVSALIQLYRSLGGGWQAQEPEPDSNAQE